MTIEVLQVQPITVLNELEALLLADWENHKRPEWSATWAKQPLAVYHVRLPDGTERRWIAPRHERIVEGTAVRDVGWQHQAQHADRGEITRIETIERLEPHV